MLLIALCVCPYTYIHVYADSPKVPPEPKTGRKQSAAVSKALGSVQAAGAYTGLLLDNE